MFRINHTPFGPHLIDETTEAYIAPIVALVSTLLRRQSANGVRLSTTSAIDTKVDDLEQALGITPKDKAAVSSALYALLSAMWTTDWDPATGRHIEDPTIQWIVFHQLHTGGSFSPPITLTNVLARFKFMIKLVHANTILHATRDATGRRVGNEEIEWQRVSKYCTVGAEATFNSLCSMQHLASAIAYLTMGMPLVWWTDSKGHTSMLYKGQPIDLDHLRQITAKLERKLVDWWEEKCLLGLKCHVDWSKATDDLSNREVGYSCFAKSGNQCFREKNRLGRMFTMDEGIKAQFYVGKRKEDGQSIWNKRKLEEWLRNYGKLNRTLAALCDITGGSPTRISELGALVFHNTAARPTRSFYLLGQHVSLIRSYGKQANQRGYEKMVPHGLSAVTGDILLQSLYIARDFATFAAEQIWGASSEQHQLYRDRVFVDYDRPMIHTAVTMELKSAAVGVLEWQPGVADYRQILLAFSRHHCRSLDSLAEPDEAENIREEQAGHTAATGRKNYGISNEVLGNVRLAEEIIPQFLDYSADMQRVLHVVPGKLTTNSAKPKSLLRYII